MIRTCLFANRIIISSFLCFYVLLSVSVRKGESVTLNPATEIQTGDEIQWLFGAGDTLIAEIKGEAREIKVHDPDWRFLGRLELKETGSLTIRNTKAAFTGVYTSKIRRGRETLYKRLIVSVEGESLWSVFSDHFSLQCVSVFGYYKLCLKKKSLHWPILEVAMGESFTLNTATEINKDDWIQWRFNNEKEATIIAEIKTRKIFKYDGPDGTFRDRLELDKETGSLTITNTRTEHSGFYTLKIRRGTKETLYKSFCISVREWMVAEMEGESVTLKPATEINKDDSIQWLYGDEEQQTVIAEFTGETGEIFTYAHVADGRFRDRLELDKTTGSLAIKNTRTELSGLYHLQIRSSSGLSYQTFSKLLIGDDSVTLNPDTEIQRDDLILWMFGVQDKLIAQIKGGTGEIYGDANERFRDRLKLNEKTGSLTITNIEAEHLGLYKVLTISSSRGTLCKIFRGMCTGLFLFFIQHHLMSGSEFARSLGSSPAKIAWV
uniref:Immunoglobulin domain-containing protein n=1 Tax=Sinocyclocheilus rhinocerous TaxID=307959 RepID=A0A673L1W4_9TELE